MSSDDETRYLNEQTYIVSNQQSDRINAIFERFLDYYTPFGFQSKVESLKYYPLPYKPGENDDLLLSEPWRVRLELYVNHRPMHMGLDLYGDVILGRGKSKPGQIIVNLENYDALELGVSRQHLLLRPTSRHLFAIDQGSTNGTIVNGIPVGPGMARALNDEDIVNLGNMVIMMHMISRPTPGTGKTTNPLKGLIQPPASSVPGDSPPATEKDSRPLTGQTGPPEKPEAL